MHDLADCYRKSPGHLSEAISLLTKAAALGYTPAIYNLGIIHRDGVGVERSLSTAWQYFLVAAAKGNSDAQFEVALCYYNGHGVDRDLFKAEKWLCASADQGIEGSLSFL